MTAAAGDRSPLDSVGETSSPDRSARQAVLIGLVWLLLAVVLAGTPNVLGRGDAHLSIPTASSLVHDRDLDLAEYAAVPNVADHYAFTPTPAGQVDFFPWTTAVAAVPVVVVTEVLSSLTGSPTTDDLIRTDRSWTLQLVTASALTAAAALLMAATALQLMGLLGRREWCGGADNTWWRRPAALAGLGALIALSTPLWSTTSRSLTQHSAALALVSAAALLAISRPTPLNALTAGALSGLALWVRPTSIAGAGGLAMLILWRDRRMIMPFALGAIAATASVLGANLLLLGTTRPTYFSGGRVGWHSAFPQAVAANLLSPARGLVLFCPQVLLPLALLNRRVREAQTPAIRRFTIAGAVVTISLVGLVSLYGYQWWAGHSFGPRFMIESMPFLIPSAIAASAALIALDSWRKWTAALTVMVWLVAVAIHLQGAWFHSTACWNDPGDPSVADVDDAPQRVWDFRNPQIVSGYVELVRDGPAKAVWTPCRGDAP